MGAPPSPPASAATGAPCAPAAPRTSRGSAPRQSPAVDSQCIIPSLLRALLSFIGDLPQGGRAHTSVLSPPPFGPSKTRLNETAIRRDAPHAKRNRLRLTFSPGFLAVGVQQLMFWISSRPRALNYCTHTSSEKNNWILYGSTYHSMYLGSPLPNTSCNQHQSKHVIKSSQIRKQRFSNTRQARTTRIGKLELDEGFQP